MFVTLVTPLGAPGLLAGLFVSAAVPAIGLWRLDRKGLTASLIGVAFAALVLAILSVRPDRGKQYWIFPQESVEFSEWNPISRIDVVAMPGVPWKKFILIDGDAQAPMFLDGALVPGRPLVPLDTPQRQALYALAPPGSIERVLVIGAGGGADVLTAKRFGARHVEAVEINPTTARIRRDQFAGFTGHLFSRDGVALYNEDGRSFAARPGNRYDAIVLFAVDSLAASSTGAYVLMENYLYTLEAFMRYWQLLSDRGVLQIGRWYYRGAARNPQGVHDGVRSALGAWRR